jgi:hypothetical protein
MDHLCGKHQRLDRLLTAERVVAGYSIPSHSPMGATLDLVGSGARVGDLFATDFPRQIPV